GQKITYTYDAGGNILTVTNTPAPDSQVPTVPTKLSVTSRTSTSITLSWTASTDDVGVTGYDIYKGSILMGSTKGATAYTVKGLTPGVMYNFNIKAKDAFGNVSGASSTLQAAPLGVDGEILYNPSFDVSSDGWYAFACNNSQIKSSRDTTLFDSRPASFKIECIKNTSLTTSIQFFSTTGVNIEQGKKYRLKFKAKSTKNFNIQSIFLGKGADEYTNVLAGSFVGRSWTEYTVNFTANTSASDALLYVYLGKTMPAGTVLNIDSFSLKEVKEDVSSHSWEKSLWNLIDLLIRFFYR
ncbi:MAG TPA: carbohydrate binding domain-containing protein, partial [Clostridia bacterium]|nr:carbohydrate binding domain-containing protein [Clostridia bacterium]